MKRFTMTPSSRNPVKIPTSGVKAAPFPRQSIMNEETKRRDVRAVREKGYRQQCVDTILRFLSENGYEGQISQKVLHNPSSKDFQSIFRFLYGFIDNFEFTSRFEDDVVNLMKSLKYPYCGEITKSQLTAITPHTWPVILSMCSWLVELVTKSSALLEEEALDNTVESHFFRYVCGGYMKFMEGDEDDRELEEEFERNVASAYTDIFSEIDRKKEELEKMEGRIKEAKKGVDGKAELDRKKAELGEDLNMLIASGKQVEGKKRKYMSTMERLEEDIYKVEKEIERLREQESELRSQITRQKINPEDIKGMNVEKMELFRELERMKPEKEGLMRAVGEYEKELQEMVEEVEKLFFDLKGVRDEFSLRIVREGKEGARGGMKICNDTNGQVLLDGMGGIIEALEEEARGKREVLVTAEINKSMLEEARAEKEGTCGEMNNKLKYCSDKLVTTGRLYLEKKEISENEQRKSKTEMELLESELLKLNLESNTSLLMSEQKLQKARIMLDRTLNSITYEREEISKMVFNFYNMVNGIYTAIQQQVEELRGLLDQ